MGFLFVKGDIIFHFVILSSLNQIYQESQQLLYYKIRKNIVENPLDSIKQDL